MKYLDPKFSTPANSRAYVEGWERCFGEEEATPEAPAQEAVPEAPAEEAAPEAEKVVEPFCRGFKFRIRIGKSCSWHLSRTATICCCM